MKRKNLGRKINKTKQRLNKREGIDKRMKEKRKRLSTEKKCDWGWVGVKVSNRKILKRMCRSSKIKTK